jgi:hypothetical protein
MKFVRNGRCSRRCSSGRFGGCSRSRSRAQPARPIPTRDDAQDAADKQRELARRRGGAADMVTGAYGAEAGAGGKTTLGS